MVDIETLGQHEDAHILSIAACPFDPYAYRNNEAGIHEPEAYVGPSAFCHHVGKAQGRTVEVGTALWWAEQSKEARSAMLSGQEAALPLPVVLENLRRYINLMKPEEVWAHGITFDLVILDHAYRQCKLRTPWVYQSQRDTRTIFGLIPPDEVFDIWPENSRKHDPRWDVACQIVAVQRAYKFLGLQAYQL